MAASPADLEATAATADKDFDAQHGVDTNEAEGLLSGWRCARTEPSLPEAHATLKYPKDGASPWRMLLAFGGCGTLISVGYM
jgi:hypothetical protein